MCCSPKITRKVLTVYEEAFPQGERKAKYKCLKTDKVAEH